MTSFYILSRSTVYTDGFLLGEHVTMSMASAGLEGVLF